MQKKKKIQTNAPLDCNCEKRRIPNMQARAAIFDHNYTFLATLRTGNSSLGDLLQLIAF